MLPENLELWHQDEERCRAESLKFIGQSEPLSAHLALILDSLYVIIEFGRKHLHQNDDEFAIQLLGVRMVNTVLAGLKLVLSGYHPPAAHLLRDLQETANLLDYFLIEPAKVAEWRTADEKGQKAFRPSKVRLALEQHSPGLGGRGTSYKRLSTVGTHPTYRGFAFINLQGEVKAGPIAEPRRLQDWLLETALWVAHGALSLTEQLRQPKPELEADRTTLKSAAHAWAERHLGAQLKAGQP